MTYCPVPERQNFMNDKEKRKERQRKEEERLFNSCKFYVYTCITVSICMYAIIMLIVVSFMDFGGDDEELEYGSSSS